MTGRPLVLRTGVMITLVLAFSWSVPAVTAIPAPNTERNPARQGNPPSATGLTVTSVSPWVAPDGNFQVRFAPSTSVPLDAVFSYTVQQRLRPDGDESLRYSVERVLDGGALPGVLQAPVSTPVTTLGNPVEGLVLNVPVRSSREGPDRVLLPTPGIHPVTLRLTDSTGREIWKTVVFLNRLPQDPVVGRNGTPARLSVTLVTPVDGPPTPAGVAAVSDSTSSALAGVTALLTQVPEAPLTLALRPNTLRAASRSSDPVDRNFLIAARASTTVATTTRWPYVAVDTAGLVAAAAGGELFRQVALGDTVVADTTGRRPTTANWYLDDTLSPESLDLVKYLGARRVVVSPERLRMGGNAPPELLRTMSVGLQGATGLTVTATDLQLSNRLASGSNPPAQRANQIVTELLSSWFAAIEQPETSFPGPSSVIVVPPGTDPAALAALSAALRAGGPLSSDPADVPATAAVRNGRELTATLTPRTPTDERGPVESVRTTRALIDGYRSMAPDSQSELLEWDLLNSETLSTDMSASQRGALHARIKAAIDQRVAAVRPPRSRRVVLTSRNATIPLRFRNDLPVDVRLIMRTRSLRLEIGGGETREIVLKPGENRIDLPVVVRASGGSLLRVDLRSPDGGIRLPETTLPVASSTISGVGAALSIISLAFLAAWWIRTIGRRRRRDARMNRRHPVEHHDQGSATSAADGHEPQPERSDGTTALPIAGRSGR